MKEAPKPAEPTAPSNCLPRRRVPESKERAVQQVGPGPPALSPPKTGPFAGRKGVRTGSVGVGSGVFKSLGRRLHLRAMNERGREGLRAGPSRTAAGLPPAASPGPTSQLAGLTPLGAASPTGLPVPPPPRAPGHPPPFSPSADPFTFQQPLDDAVDVEFIYIRHRLPTADPPAAAPPPARARDSHLLSHATSTEAAVAAVAAAAAGPPPTAPLPASSFSPHWNHEKNKMAADSLASLGRRTDARGGVQRLGRDFFMGHRARGMGRDQSAGRGRGQSAGIGGDG